MSSTRFPGKVLSDLAGRPMLAWTLDRVRNARQVDHVVVATSDDATDDPVERFCDGTNVACHRGPLNDVAGRFLQVVLQEQADAFVRICGDSPLIDPELIDQGICLYGNEECDLATNVLVRTYPRGQSVEVVRKKTFCRLCDSTKNSSDREHVTRAFYKQPERYRIADFRSDMDARHVKLAVDTDADHETLNRVIAASNGSPGGWRDLVQIMEQLKLE